MLAGLSEELYDLFRCLLQPAYPSSKIRSIETENIDLLNIKIKVFAMG